jgi:hypothetical protein
MAGFQLSINGRFWVSTEESYRWETLILRNGELFSSRGAFALKADAIQWAEKRRNDAARGFLD